MTSDIKKSIIADYSENGVAVVDIAARYNISRSHIYNVINAAGIETRRPRRKQAGVSYACPKCKKSITFRAPDTARFAGRILDLKRLGRRSGCWVYEACVSFYPQTLGTTT